MDFVNFVTLVYFGLFLSLDNLDWYFRLNSSPVLVDTHVRTMPRNMHINGNDWSEDSPTPPPPPPPHHGSLGPQGPHGNTNGSATLPIKKKSVTIGTFTTMVEPFEIENNSPSDNSLMTSAVWHSPKRVAELNNDLEAATRFNGSDSDGETTQMVAMEVWQKKAVQNGLDAL